MVKNHFHGKVTGIGHIRRAPNLAIRRDLTRNISSVLGDVQDETHYALAKEMPPRDEWTQVNAYLKVLRTVALLSGRVFIGLPFSRDEEWIMTSINFTMETAMVRKQLLSCHPILPPFLVNRLPAVQNVKKHQKTAQKIMQQRLEEILSDDLEKSVPSAGARKTSFLHWLVSHMEPEERNAERLGMDQLLLSFAAIHTTCKTTPAHTQPRPDT